SNLAGIRFPDGVSDPVVSRIATDIFPVMQLSVLGERDIPSLQRVVDNLIVPAIERVDGVFQAGVIGRIDEQVSIKADPDKLEDLGLTLSQVAAALSDNNISLPAGSIDDGNASYPVRTSHKLGSLQEFRDLVIGFEKDGSGILISRPIKLSDVAQVEISTEKARQISRTNGKPSLGIVVIKEPDANTVDVTEGVLESLEHVQGLPPDVEIITITNDGPEVKSQLDTLLNEGLLGFFFAISVVFIFLANIRPGLIRGITLALRPTLIIGISIPLSILTGVLIMGFTDLSLNFMTLAGLAIAVGRVVDDSIVVLENMYRHLQAGEERIQAAVEGTREVGAAIIASTLTTVVVFVPLAFIQGLVGAFFSPFAMSVSFALLASTLVALTAVPTLGVVLLRRGDFPDSDATDADGTGGVGQASGIQMGFSQRVYASALVWTLGHKFLTILAAVAITVASLGLTLIIPTTLFPAGTPQFITIDLELPTGTSVTNTYRQVLKVEEVLEEFRSRGMVEAYMAFLGSSTENFAGGGTGGFHLAGVVVTLAEDVPKSITEDIRKLLPGDEETTITVAEISGGPPTDQLEVTVTGSKFSSISSAAKQVQAQVESIEGVINVSSDVSSARQEVSIEVDPQMAAEFGLSVSAVALQVNRYLVGEVVSQVDLEDVTMDVVLTGLRGDTDAIDKLSGLAIQGPFGNVRLGSISRIALEGGPVTISRFDRERSARITGDIIAEDTKAVGNELEKRIAALDLPPGVSVKTGGIFTQITEGFEDVFTAMAVGVILVYLVMVASLGSLRNPLVVVICLPLAVVGALSALAVTDRTLSLSALMGLLLLIGVVVTNAIVLITFVEQLRERGYGVYDALLEGGQVRLRPILMTAFTTIFALMPLAFSTSDNSGIIGAELATVVIGGLVSSTFLTLIVVPVVYTLAHESVPNALARLGSAVVRLNPLRQTADPQTGGPQAGNP
ncbi:MAG: efflux RND transporter permease subunit, partial [Chloroflexi bacterium]|nr:efflux RND transporter permease subunit [Chloroflexota bacterium]